MIEMKLQRPHIMKSHLLPVRLITLAFLLALSITASPLNCVAAEQKIQVDKRHHFGTLPEGSLVYHDFVIKNNKDTGLQIKQVKAG